MRASLSLSLRSSHRPLAPLPALALALSLGACGRDAPTVMPPSAMVPPRGTQQFTVMSGTPGSWRVSTGASGGSVDAGGLYHAGATPDVTDVLTVTFDGGDVVTVPITVGPGVSITPERATVRPFGEVRLTASGGSGTGYTFALTTPSPSGRIDATGRYRAGAGGHDDDEVLVTDSLGNTRKTSVHVLAPLTVRPAFQLVEPGSDVALSVDGGTPPYTFALSAAPSGATVDVGGGYHGGSRGGTDVLRIHDSDGAEGTAVIRVRPPAIPGFTPAAHKVDPILPRGGPVLAHPTMVTITYANDPNRDTMERFGEFLAGSDWLLQAGAEYGVGSGTHIAVRLPMNAPPRIDDATVIANIAGWINDGTLPYSPDGDFFYSMQLPISTTETVAGSPLCVYSGGGYHYEGESDLGTFAYAVTQPCREEGLTGLQVLEQATAHELIEAATDPYPASNPAFHIGRNLLDPWSQIGGELGDKCSWGPASTIEGYYIQPVWSNASAMAGDPPCQPEPGPWFSLAASPAAVLSGTAGSSVTFTLTGWSSQPMAAWKFYAAPMSAGCCKSFMPTLTLARDTLANGDTTTLRADIPPGVPRGSMELIYLGPSTGTRMGTAAVLGVMVQ